MSSVEGSSTILAASDEITGIPCDCGQNLEVTVFCEDHNEVACQTCRMLKHRNCKTTLLGEKGSSYHRKDLSSIEEQANKVMADTYHMLKKRQTDLRHLASIKEKCIKDIRNFRNDINMVFDSLEENIIKDTENFNSQERQLIEHHISSCSTTKQLIEKDLKLLNDVKTASEETSMFAVDVKVTNHLKTYEQLLTDIAKEFKSPQLKFKPDARLSNVLEDVKELGSLTVDHVKPSLLKGSLFLDLKVEHAFQVDIKTHTDTTTPSISGCAFMPDGRIILCDHVNKTVKLLDKSFRLEDSIHLLCSPFDVSVINNNKAVVTLPDKKQLQYLKIIPKVNTEVFVQLDSECWGVEVAGDEIFTSCHSHYWLSTVADIRVFDLNGRLKRKVDLKSHFYYPYYLSVNSCSGKIFVSDVHISAITCLTSEGNDIYRYTDKGLKDTRAICVDYEDNVLVCGEKSNNLYVIGKNGEKTTTLLTRENDIEKPRAVAYRHSDGTVVVGCRDTNKLYAFFTK